MSAINGQGAHHPGCPGGRPAPFLPTRFRDARVVTVIRVIVAEGDGTSRDPFREVVQYIATSGELLAINDPSRGGPR